MKSCQFCGEQIISSASDRNHELECARNPVVWLAAIRVEWAEYIKRNGVAPELVSLRKVIEGNER